MKIKKGGYSVKNGFYIKNDIKNDCKNNDEDGSLDEDGYILDPLTYERIKEGYLIQLSDGICYSKSAGLSRNIKDRNSLPFGHAVTGLDKIKLSKDNIKPIKRLIIESSSDSEDEIIPAPRRIPTPSEEEEFEITPVRRTRLPVQINIPAPRIPTPLGGINRTRRQRPVLIIEGDSAEEIGNSGRGTKKRKLKSKSKRKSKGKTKRKSKY